jgi:hypothetical protein
VGDSAERFALYELMCAYAACLDAHDPHRFAALFLPDGRLAAKLPDGTEFVRVGAEELITNVRAFQDPGPFRQTLHVVGNHVVEIDGDRASGWMHCVAHHLVERDGEYFDEIQFLRYDDTYARTKDGWRFANRSISLYWDELVPAARGSGLGSRPDAVPVGGVA